MQIVIDQDGTTRFVASDAIDAGQLGEATKTRASHVLPVNPLLRVVFRWLRDRYGETGRVAAFTRRWPCVWQADLSPVGGPVLGPFVDRGEAIKAEVQFIESFVL